MVTDINDDLLRDTEDDEPLVTQLRKIARALKRERNEALDQVNTFTATKREENLDKWLETAHLDPAVKAYVPDTVSDAASLAAWLGNEGKLFAQLTIKGEAPTPETPAQPNPQTPAFEDSEYARLLGRISGTESSAQSVNPADVDALFKQIQDAGANATSDTALAEALANIQLPPGFGQ